MSTDAIAWRVERACAAAYPPRVSHRIGDWTVALSGGGSRRSNSASAIAPAAALDSATLAAIASRFDQAGLPTIVRVTDLAPGASAALDAAGFARPEGRTRTLLRESVADIDRANGVAIAAVPDFHWLAVRRRCAPAAEHPQEVAARLAVPAAYARRSDDGAVCAIGYAAIHDGIAVIEAVATATAARRRGHARAIVAALLGWAGGQGARHAALQVEEENDAARALYGGLGFAIDLYGYHYRRGAASLADAAGVGSPRP